jgi:uncharacterized membrane protein YgdD (TMEM256/DUF423 family)
MRLIRIPAALSGAVATAILVAAAHPLRDLVGEDQIGPIILGATLQLGCAIMAMVAGNWGGRLAPIASTMMTFGSAAFSAVVFVNVVFAFSGVDPLAPLGGLAAVIGWAMLAFTDKRAA